MRKTICILVLLFLILSPASATLKNKKHEKAWNATLVLYGHSDTPNVTKPMCTAFVYRKINGGYKLLTEGHCIKSDGVPADATYLVAEDLNADTEKNLQPVKVLRAVYDKTDDIAELELKTAKTYPVLEISSSPADLEEPLFSVGFPETDIKEIVTGRLAGLPVSFSINEDCDICLGREFAQLAGGPRASGSPILSEKTGKVVGILEGNQASGLVVIFPSSRVITWLFTK